MEALLFNARHRHYNTNLHLEAVSLNLLQLVEAENGLLKLVRQAATIVQGDHPDWESVGDLSDSDPDVLACRAAIQKWLHHQLFFIEKIRAIRDHLVYIRIRKKEFLRMLRENALAIQR
jgi:hypothetical protein